MAKGKKNVSEQVVAHAAPAAVVPEVNVPDSPPEKGIRSFRLQAIIVVLLSLIFYGNTLKNEWAFDDMLVIIQNEYVQEGFAGIPKIMTGDAFESFTKSQNETSNQLTGGRYRPLSMITFAMEQQVFGLERRDPADTSLKNPAVYKAKRQKFLNEMHIRHGVNVALFALSVVVLLIMLRYIVFPGNPVAAFIATIIFTIHPIHTEVVANVKSRDEILSFLFICLTFIQSFRYYDTRKKNHLWLSMLCFLLALLSKEYGVVLVVLLPLAFYYFRKTDITGGLKQMLPMLAPLAVYGALRLSAVKPADAIAESDVMNMPYVYATPIEKLASEFSVLLRYLKLLVYPHPLSADYSYNQLPYTNFADPLVWLSVVIYAAGGYFFIKTFRQRHIVGFAIAFYLVFLALVSNFFVNIGAPMGERLIYHSSAGFAIIIGYLLAKAVEEPRFATAGRIAVPALLGIVTVFAAIKTIARNSEWHSNVTLFIKDVQTVPRSVIAHSNAGMACLELSSLGSSEQIRIDYIKKAVAHFDTAININPRFVVAYINRCDAHLKLGNMEKAFQDCDTVVKYYPVHPSLPYLVAPLTTYLTAEGVKFAQQNMVAPAIAAFRKAAAIAPADANVLYNLGFALCRAGITEEGKQYLLKVLQVQPGHPQATLVLQQIGAAPGTLSIPH